MAQEMRLNAQGLHKKMSNAKYQIPNQILISEMWVSVLCFGFPEINHRMDQDRGRELKEKSSGNSVSPVRVY